MTLLAITHDEISATVNAADRVQHQLTRHDHSPIIRTGMESRMFVRIMRDLVVTSPPCGGGYDRHSGDAGRHFLWSLGPTRQVGVAAVG